MKLSNIPVQVLEACRQRDLSDEDISTLSPKQLFAEFCDEQGFINWGRYLWELIENLEQREQLDQLSEAELEELSSDPQPVDPVGLVGKLTEEQQKQIASVHPLHKGSAIRRQMEISRQRHMEELEQREQLDEVLSDDPQP